MTKEGSAFEQFIAKLEEKYGPWSQATARFGNATYGEIAKSLNISASQFSKLLYGTATEGMYLRTIENIKRLIRQDSIRNERDKALEDFKRFRALQTRNIIITAAFMFLLGAIAVYLYDHRNMADGESNSVTGHPLQHYFEQGIDAAFDSPYLRETEVREYCPCSAFEGKWTMDTPFKLPLPGSRRPGLYYLARSSDLRLRCSNISAPYVGKGKAMLGHEFFVSEIWLDTEQQPLIPDYFDIEKKQFTPAFDVLKFEDEPHFIKLAELHAFNVNSFEIHPDSIVRRAELTGRFAADIDHATAKEYNIDIRHIVRNVLGNLTTTDCASVPNPYCEPNDLVEGESVMAFDCIYTIKTENLGLGGGYPYVKTFRLDKQHYSDHLECKCEAL